MTKESKEERKESNERIEKCIPMRGGGGGGEFLEASPKAPLADRLSRTHTWTRACDWCHRAIDYTHNCHPELDSGSHQQTPVECNAGEIPDQVRNDNKKRTLKLFTASPLKRAAFTMAEILLSLTIIGVVAAITLPSLTGNINERTWNTQKKALYARMSQAVLLMPSFNNYGVYVAEVNDGRGHIITPAQDTAAETFLTAGLSKVLKMNNICDNDNLSDCGVSLTINNLLGEKITFPKKFGSLNGWIENYASGSNTKAAAFITNNGETVVTYYNPTCSAKPTEINDSTSSGNWFCANFIFDLNGKKGPNTVGKDIGFMSLMYANDSVLVLPNVTRTFLPDLYSSDGAYDACKNALGTDYRLPNQEEGMSLFLNRRLIVAADSEQHLLDGQVSIWTSSFRSNGLRITVRMDTGTLVGGSNANNCIVWCLNR